MDSRAIKSFLSLVSTLLRLLMKQRLNSQTRLIVTLLQSEIAEYRNMLNSELREVKMQYSHKRNLKEYLGDFTVESSHAVMETFRSFYSQYDSQSYQITELSRKLHEMKRDSKYGINSNTRIVFHNGITIFARYLKDESDLSEME